MEFRSPEDQMRENLIVKHYAGSHAYGTSLPTSDVDFRGIFVADQEWTRTPFFNVNEVTDTTEEDTKIFELGKFLKLAATCNPNVIETLWVDPADIIHDTPAYQTLRAAAPSLLSREIAFTTCGYALSQLKRIKGHNKWINNPQPEARPQHKDYVSLVHNFTDEKIFKFPIDEYRNDHRLVPYSGNTMGVYAATGYQLYADNGALNTDYDGNQHELPTPKFLIKFNEAEYKAARDTWDQYWTWKKNRNASRSELEELHGFDTKHAMHLVRLLRMGHEALTEGIVRVKRPDAEELLGIRAGKWSYDELVKYAEDMNDLIKNKLLLTTHLPPRPPSVHVLARLMMQIQDAVWAS